MRFFYYSLDYTLGYWIRLAPQLARGNLLILERYFFDYFVDRRQEGVRLPRWLLRGVCSLFPRPRIAYLLTTDPDTAYRRRADLDRDEIARQMGEYAELPQWNPEVRALDATPAANRVARDALAGLFSALIHER